MTLRVTTTHAADADIRDIVTYIAIDSRGAAERFIDALDNTFRVLATKHEIGTPVLDFRLSLRRIRVSRRFRRYLIFFHQIDSETVEVVRVLHGARDIARILRGL